MLDLNKEITWIAEAQDPARMALIACSKGWFHYVFEF